MSKAIDRIKEKAEQLANLRREIKVIEEATDVALSEKKAQRDKLQDELLLAFEKEGLSSIKVAEGDTYARSTRKGVSIVDELRAFDWAYKNRAVTIDKRIVAQKLKDMKEVPNGFELVETAFISVRSAKKENAEN